MQYVNVIVAVALLAMAVLRWNDPVAASMFVVGAVLAMIAFKHWLSTWTVRLLAVVTAGALFFYFAQFFILVPTLPPNWYAEGQAIDAVGLLFAGFAMIPVLSEYSCRMKAGKECERARRQFKERKPILAPLRHSETSRPVS